MSQDPPARHVLARDTPCDPLCPYYGLDDFPSHSHWRPEQEPVPLTRPGWFWRVLFRVWGNGGI